MFSKVFEYMFGQLLPADQKIFVGKSIFFLVPSTIYTPITPHFWAIKSLLISIKLLIILIILIILNIHDSVYVMITSWLSDYHRPSFSAHGSPMVPIPPAPGLWWNAGEAQSRSRLRPEAEHPGHVATPRPAGAGRPVGAGRGCLSGEKMETKKIPRTFQWRDIYLGHFFKV